jgi:hypothetical protein
MNKQLDCPPISGQYEEIIFDLADPWHGQNWHYVIFTTSDGNEWCGHFREKDSNNFLLAELTDKNIACIVSGGHGSIIDIDKKEKIKELDRNMIISLASDNLSSSFIISTYWSIYRIDNNYNLTEINLPIQADGIYFIDTIDKKLLLDIEEIGADMKHNKDYYIDLNDWNIKKHRA